MAKITAIGIAVAICIGLVGYALYWDTTEVPKLKAQAENHIALQENILVSKMSRTLQSEYRMLARYNQISPGAVTQLIKDNLIWSYRVTDIYEVRAKALVEFYLEDPEALDYREFIAVFPYNVKILSKGISHDLDTDAVVIRSNLP